MNKKNLAVIGLSGAILLGSVYSISANTSGYELYKSALKETHKADSTTMKISFTLEDNEKPLFSMNSLMKADVEQQVSSISTDLANETETSHMNLFKQDGDWFVKKEGNDIFFKMDSSKKIHGKGNLELQDDLENLIDVMTKNLQQQITVDENKKGGQTIELDLTGKEIPLTANALSSLLIKHAVLLQDSGNQEVSEFHIKPTIPELDHDITVKQINISAMVNKANYVDQQTVKMVVTGKDKQDQAHEIVLRLKLDVSEYNHTTVAPVQIPTEKVEVLKMNHGQ